MYFGSERLSGIVIGPFVDGARGRYARGLLDGFEVFYRGLNVFAMYVLMARLSAQRWFSKSLFEGRFPPVLHQVQPDVGYPRHKHSGSTALPTPARFRALLAVPPVVFGGTDSHDSFAPPRSDGDSYGGRAGTRQRAAPGLAPAPSMARSSVVR